MIPRVCSLRSLVFASALLLAASAMSAQNFPGKVHIYNAAQQMNAIAPQAIAQQTIEIGTYNGGTNTFHFALGPSYPPNVPAYKRVENGGNVPPRYVPMINSYNVKYEFKIIDKPAGFGITVEVPEADGRMVKKEAVITTGGTRASVTFNPKSFRAQVITIHRPGGDTTVRVHPNLRPQLGAFVVPYQLITIIYEPPGLGSVPGSGSNSTFKQTSTANTVMTWDFARTSGLVETVTNGGMYDMFGQAMGLGAGVILGQAGDKAMLEALEASAEGSAAGAKVAGQASQTAVGAIPILAAVKVILDLTKGPDVTTTTTQTTGTTTTQGISIAVSASYTTKIHRYPGAGDLFVVLHDVLYAYLAHDGKVYLAPIAYSGVDYYTAPELRQKLPSVAKQYIALDPHLSAPMLYAASSRSQAVVKGQTILSQVLDRASISSGSFSARFVPFGAYQHVSCKATGNPSIELSREDFQSTATTHTKSTTVVEQMTGLGALVGGGGDNLQGTTYSTAMQQGTSQEQSTSITLDCGSADQFWVDVYLDKVFRTFLALRGEPIDAAPGFVAMAGVAHRPDGSRSARQSMRLRIGGETYVTRSDDNGNFSFPSRALPHGAGQIQIGNERYSVSYAGVPKNLSLRGGVVAETATPTATPASTQPKGVLPTIVVPRKLPPSGHRRNTP